MKQVAKHLHFATTLYHELPKANIFATPLVSVALKNTYILQLFHIMNCPKWTFLQPHYSVAIKYVLYFNTKIYFKDFTVYSV